MSAAQNTEAWQRYYPRLKAFHATHGHCNVPRGGRLESLRGWLISENHAASSPDYSPKRRALLEALGHQFHDGNRRLWQMRIAQLGEYVAAKGTWCVGEERPELRFWLFTVRKKARDGLLAPDLVGELEALGVTVARLPTGPKSGHKTTRIAVPAGEAYGSDSDHPEADRPRA